MIAFGCWLTALCVPILLFCAASRVEKQLRKQLDAEHKGHEEELLRVREESS